MIKTSTILSLVIASAVVLSGMHAKDVAVIPVSNNAPSHDEQVLKVASELHNHVDKQSGKLLSSSDSPQSDTRSLRLVRNVKKLNRTPSNPLAVWREYLALYLG